jgi:HD-GYP domain-containing protein (c-di-GMP phosphodiesterase class II)
MVVVHVSTLKSGEKLINDVRTSLGNLLMAKTRKLSPRDVEILQAFLIPSVDIEGDPNDPNIVGIEVIADEPLIQNDPIASFREEYNELYSMMKQSFASLVSGGNALKLLELRSKQEKLLKSVNMYDPLSFVPPRTNDEDDWMHISIMVGLTGYHIARWMLLPQMDTVSIAFAGLVHNIGNLQIQKSILNKTAPLTASEFEEYKKHTVYGFNLLKNVPSLNEGIKLSALQHHERMDGTGYPLGLKTEKIHLYAKVIAIADHFHSTTFTRQQNRMASPFLELENMMKEAYWRYESSIVLTFAFNATGLRSGSMVKLNDGSLAEVMFVDRNKPTRPIVNVGGQIIQLATDRERYIQEVVKRG